MQKARVRATKRESSKAPLDGKTIMRIHGAHWSSLTQAERDGYAFKAIGVRSASQHVLDEQIADTETRLRIAEMREETTSRTQSTSMVSSGARLPESALDTWSTLSRAAVFADNKVQNISKQHLSGVEPMSVEREQELMEASHLLPPESQNRSPLYMRVAKDRQKFLNACFAITSGGSVLWYRCILAIAQPSLLQFLPLEERSVDEVSFDLKAPISTWSSLLHASFSFQWTFPEVVFTSRDIFMDVDPDFVGVVTPSVFKAAGTLVAWTDMVSLSFLLDSEDEP
eukprot:5594024-Amphidinium_carterae.1